MSRESLLREARTTEAMKKGYMGLEGKFAVIAKTLGHPIIQHGGNTVENNFIDDPFDLRDEDDMPTMDAEDSSHELGVHFDGLSSGINLSITVNHYHREISCTFEGRKVYVEMSGELEGFAPGESWESHIETLYGRARKIEKTRKPEERKRLNAEADRRRRQILEDFRDKWGLT